MGKTDNFCYLKTASMATRHSEVWDSNVWSGRLIYCSTNLDIEWTRVCQKERYLSCIKDIMEEEGIKNGTRTVPRVLNDISDEDRAKFDTLNSEFNCLDEFCPWTPTDTIKGCSQWLGSSCLESKTGNIPECQMCGGRQRITKQWE